MTVSKNKFIILFGFMKTLDMFAQYKLADHLKFSDTQEMYSAYKLMGLSMIVSAILFVTSLALVMIYMDSVKTIAYAALTFYVLLILMNMVLKYKLNAKTLRVNDAK